MPWTGSRPGRMRCCTRRAPPTTRMATSRPSRTGRASREPIPMTLSISLTRVDYVDGSFTTYTWDAGNRLTRVVDSLTGNIIRTPDLLDRLQQEVTAQGTVSYGYDNANRRTSM